MEVDETYFGGIRKGKRGQGTGGKVPVCGLLKRGGKVDTKVIPDASAETLVAIICEKVVPDSIVYSDYWRGYNSLMFLESNIIALTIQSFWLINTTLMELRTFGIKLKGT